MQYPLDHRQFPEIILDASPAYEFLISLDEFCGAEDRLALEAGHEWIETVRAKASPDLLQAVDLLSGRVGKLWTNLLGLVYDCPPPKNVSAFISHLETMDALTLRLCLIGYYTHSMRRIIAPDVMFRAAEGDTAAQDLFTQVDWSRYCDCQRVLRQIFALDVETMKTLMLDTMRRWYDEVFREHESQVMPILLRDIEAKRALMQTVSPERFIELAANGYEYMPEPHVREIFLIPGFLNRPYIFISEYLHVKILCYPVADENLANDPDAPPAQLVRLYKALGDERRLRILRMLAQRSLTLQEVADEFGVAKTTIHHHCVLLRSAGLISLRTSDSRYHLRNNMVPEVSRLLETYLKRSNTQADKNRR
jgi:DNA-binding transcriptional ArsR family regulator